MKKVFINNLLITLIFFLILEIFLKNFGLVQLKGHGEEIREKKTNIESISFGKKVYLDEYGYRVPYKGFKYKENRIVFIGDSVLFGSGVIEEKTLVGKIREFDKKKTYINAAIIGNDISEHLIEIKKNYKLFNNNTFYIFLTLDDILSAGMNEKNIVEKEKKKSFFSDLKNNYLLNKINTFLRTKSYTYLWVKGITTQPSKRYFYESFNYYKMEEKTKIFAEIIDEIKNFKQSNNLNLQFLILPYEYQTRNKCNSEILLPQKEIINIFKDKKIKYIDLTREFCSHIDPKKLFLSFDPVHLSEDGHDLVFNLVKNKFN